MVVLMALAGGLGAAARFRADGAIRRRWPSPFPWATLAVNVSGSLALGVITGLAVHHGEPADVRLVLGTGFCGGYTTFSTATLETLRLLQRDSAARAGAYLALTAAGTLGAAALGLLTLR